jgi:FkbM family methyltransferase
MPGLLSSIARTYVRRFPLDKGKYHLVQAMRQIDSPAKVVSQVAGRFLMELDLAENLQGQLYYYGYYERELTRFIESIIRPGSVMVDVGANIGTFTLLAASLGATCYSFEASPAVCAALRRNIALNKFGNITVRECAVSDHAGEASFFLYEDVGKNNSCGQSAFFRRGPGREIKVPLETLDTALSDLDRVDFIKTDVEGADFLVLRGANAILERFHPALAIEATEELASKLGGSVAEILDLLFGHGYQVHSLSRHGMVPVTRSAPPATQTTLIARYPSTTI